MHDAAETLEWYRTHQTARQIGFNPDGMCQKVCRTARNLPSRFASAKISQDNTPKRFRVTKVRDLRAGMVLYFDDPNDSNKFGHIVTMIGRAKGADWDSLDSVLVETNSVKKGELVVVRASYFKQHWGDDFQFGATWFNGFEIDVLTSNKPKPSRVARFRRSYPNYDVSLLDAAVRIDKRADIKRSRDKIDELVELLKTDKRTRQGKVRAYYAKNRILRLDQLNLAVREHPKDKSLLAVRNQLRQVVKSLS